MAKGRGRRSIGSSEITNDFSRPDPVLDGLLDPLPALPVSPLNPLDDFLGDSLPSDRRAFSFDSEPTRGTSSSGHVKLPDPVLDRAPEALSTDRVRIATCVRRQQRREVMFAKKFHKRGRGGGRRRTWRSDVRC